MAQQIDIGTIIIDNDKLGIVINKIKSGTWTEEPLFNWTTSYEIKYIDGDVCIMTEASLSRLVTSGKIKILEDKSQ